MVKTEPEMERSKEKMEARMEARMVASRTKTMLEEWKVQTTLAEEDEIQRDLKLILKLLT